jgi:hypothetical protein
MRSSKVSELIEKINGTIKSPGFPGLSKIERDLLMQRVRELYDELETWVASTDTVQNQDAENSHHGDLPNTGTLKTKRTFLSNQSLLLNEAPKEKIAPVSKEEMVAMPKKESLTAPVAEKKTESVVSINERVQTSESLNERLKASSTQEMHKKLASKPLKELIGLNQRFVILNELFKSNAEAFAAAVNHIDSLSDYPSADSFIQTQLISNYYWDETSQSARLFMKLVRQKFGVE